MNTLARGSKGALVAAVQRALKIEADGDYGPQTEAAVKAEQRRRGLVETGAVDPALLQLLNIEIGTAITPVPLKPQRVPPMAKILDIALKELGQKEVPGPNRTNPRIAEYHKTTLGYAADDDVPWCASFVRWCIERAGYSAQGTNAMAKSFLKWGEKSDGQIGDVVIFWRGSPTGSSGHVGFIVGRSGSTLHVLGGNQGNAVTIARYSTDKVVGYRRLGKGRVDFDLAAFAQHRTDSQDQA